MGYQVLARKWRPASFREMVGQEHVLKALINSLDQNRLHHAYLFTGTRGVGKTTVARIFAKSLNCETGVSSQPCGQCSACTEISEGRFVDLIEVDAASRTKVEDTRELLENVQYAPTRGRYKVYLIDEVHMLSGHSFNALLKTLEEPPEHVKFLLATTDPQQLPITILSRCLQFSLKAMTPQHIVGHLQHVLEAEMITYEEAALWQLGREARGSMRDAMSLTDQAISFGNGQVTEVDVRQMLGSIGREHVFALLQALAQQSADVLLAAIEQLAEHGPDYEQVLDALVAALHRLTVAQLVPAAVDNSEGDREQVLELAQQFAPEQLQLYYQTGLLGRRDLPLAPDARCGFEMVLLRMLLFRPQVRITGGSSGAGGGATPAKKPESPAPQIDGQGQPATPASPSSASSPLDSILANMGAVAQAEPVRPVAPQSPEPTSVEPLSVEPPAVKSPPAPPPPVVEQPQQSQQSQQPPQSSPPAAPQSSQAPPAAALPVLGDRWADLVATLTLAGPLKNFARNCALVSAEGDQWTLVIHPRYDALIRREYLPELESVLADRLKQRVTLNLNVAVSDLPTPDTLLGAYRQRQREEALSLLKADPIIQGLQTDLDAVLDDRSVEVLALD